MKDYYDILDVPMTATPDEIKTQYRQLVRIYHPDRFRNQDDKAYAEEKLKEINIAFQVLSGSAVKREPFEAQVAPQPVAYPPQLDFGAVPVGRRGRRTIQIGNLGGPAENINFVYSRKTPWFQASKGKRVYAEQPFPLDFEVTIDTRHLKPNQQYHEWMEAVLDGVPVRIDIKLQTVPQTRARPSLLRWSWAVSSLLIVVLALLILPPLGISIPQVDFGGSLLSARPSYELQANEMLFAVQENDRSVFYVGLGADTVPRRLGIGGEHAVGSQIGQRIAYIDGPTGNEQIHLFELAGGEITQITENDVQRSRLTWSPDGVRLAYLVGGGKNRRIGVYDTRVSREYMLPGEFATGVSNFIWSPDGQFLLFDLWQGDEQRVYRIDVQGDSLQQLTHFHSWAGAWSADGTKIIVGTDDGLYLLTSNGRQLRQLTSVPTASFQWSADETWVTYTTVEESTGDTSETALSEALWLLNHEAGEVEQIVSNVLWHQWNPDGTTLGYITGNLQGDDPLLYLWTIVPGQTPQLVAEVSDPFFAWPQ